MKLITVLGISATLHASTALAEAFTVEWAGRGMFAKWSSPRGDETVLSFGEGCRTNPGPKGLAELCFYNDGGYGYFRYDNEDWRCLRVTWKQGNDDAGKEIWEEVSC